MEYTNLELERIAKKAERKSDYYKSLLTKTDNIEVLSILGLWLNLGVNGFKRVPINEIFSTKKSVASIGMEKSTFYAHFFVLEAHLTFSKERYRVLMRALRFDDRRFRELKIDGTPVDKLAPLREVSFRLTLDFRNIFF